MTDKELEYTKLGASIYNPTTGKEEILIRKSKFMAVTDFVINMTSLVGLIAFSIALICLFA